MSPMPRIKCCHGCVAPKRYPGCHAHCKEYIDEKAEYLKEVKAIRSAKEKEKMADQYAIKSCKRTNEPYNRWRRKTKGGES